jgi:hypothetical protein
MSQRLFTLQDSLQIRQKLIVFRMGADPEPYDRIVNLKPQGSPADPHANRINGHAIADSFEVQTWMGGIRLP